ncbi:nicotinamide-nucleotide amidase [Paenochrobactrum gallinarii]|uniref:Nicotinamide-nucleotide amidase n=1 Tax=Paenochrobactrum gallinarii TaxID=643673 RepID=A0A841M0G9_9HYPH|nr:CinA family protein [Paenochrobactrum gallinarii]MBB6259598.1 nicotinamide-nucleotide amidase [Paenochrobactrum gallinarii]
MSELIAEVKANEVLEACRKAGFMLATAESCTGGMIIASLTDIAGSSDVVDRGFITYSNAAKTAMIGVPATLIDDKGAVSKEVALAMAQGALEQSKASVSVAVTGVAGPGGGSEAKPVGLVHIASALRGKSTILHRECRFGTDKTRTEIRHLTVLAALDLILENISQT